MARTKINKTKVGNFTKDIRSFKKWQKDHPNFVTPTVKRVENVNSTFIELSEGKGFSNQTVYGVSAIKFKDGKFSTIQDEGKSFFNLKEAKEYMGMLKDKHQTVEEFNGHYNHSVWNILLWIDSDERLHKTRNNIFEEHAKGETNTAQFNRKLNQLGAMSKAIGDIQKVIITPKEKEAVRKELREDYQTFLKDRK